MSKLKVSGIVAGVLFVAMVGLAVYLNYFAINDQTNKQSVHSTEVEEIVLPQVNNFEECVAVTNLVYTSNPAKCVAPNGKVFVNSDFVHVKVITKTEKIK